MMSVDFWDRAFTWMAGASGVVALLLAAVVLRMQFTLDRLVKRLLLIVESKANLTVVFADGQKEGDRVRVRLKPNRTARLPMIVSNIGKQSARDVVIELHVDPKVVASISGDVRIENHATHGLHVWQVYLPNPVYSEQITWRWLEVTSHVPEASFEAVVRMFWTATAPSAKPITQKFLFTTGE